MEGTEFILLFLKQKKYYIASFLLFSVIFFSSFALYRLPLKAVLYPFAVSALVCTAILLTEYRNALRRHRALSEIESFFSLPDSLPAADSVEDADYRRILNLLCEEHKKSESAAAGRYTDMMDYYTVWAHQIKTPIASMRLNLQNEDSPLSRRINSDLFRIEQYVEMVLMFLRLDSDYSDYRIREYELDPIVKQALRKFSGEFIARRLALEYEPVLLRVITDEKWLSFVIEQVLSNALKYTRAGKITVTVEDGSTLCIRDTGIGIAPEDLPRIFDKGFTGYNGRADKRASGIGLYLCRRICRNLGHTISAEPAPERGTVIKLGLGREKITPE